MARLPYLEKADLKPEDQALLARDINLHKALAHNPAAARAFSGLGQYIRHKTKLDARLRDTPGPHLHGPEDDEDLDHGGVL